MTNSKENEMTSGVATAADVAARPPSSIAIPSHLKDSTNVIDSKVGRLLTHRALLILLQWLIMLLVLCSQR